LTYLGDKALNPDNNQFARAYVGSLADPCSGTDWLLVSDDATGETGATTGVVVQPDWGLLARSGAPPKVMHFSPVNGPQSEWKGMCDEKANGPVLPGVLPGGEPVAVWTDSSDGYLLGLMNVSSLVP